MSKTASPELSPKAEREMLMQKRRGSSRRKVRAHSEASSSPAPSTAPGSPGESRSQSPPGSRFPRVAAAHPGASSPLRMASRRQGAPAPPASRRGASGIRNAPGARFSHADSHCRALAHPTARAAGPGPALFCPHGSVPGPRAAAPLPIRGLPVFAEVTSISF